MTQITSLERSDISFRLKKRRGERNRFTIVIGPNASGKSRLLRAVVDEALANDPVSEGDVQTSRVLAMSSLVTDAFRFSTPGSAEYRYLGIRQNYNSTTTGSIRDLTAHSIVLALRDEWRIGAVTAAVNMLEFSDLSISLRVRRNPSENLEPFIRALGRDHDLAGLASSDAENLRNQLVAVAKKADDRPVSSLSESIDQVQGFMAVAREWGVDPLALLRAGKRGGVDVELSFYSGGDWVDERRLSTGQLLLLSLVARIAAFVEPGSVIAVDEPETGLHPTWQSQFIPLISGSIPKNFGNHFFIATHSPHVVADGSDVLIPGSTRGAFVEYNEPFHGRTPENLLYRVFGARVTGNSLVDEDLTLLAEVVAGVRSDKSPGELRAVVDRLQNVAGDDTPVLNDLVAAVVQTGRLNG